MLHIQIKLRSINVPGFVQEKPSKNKDPQAVKLLAWCITHVLLLCQNRKKNKPKPPLLKQNFQETKCMQTLPCYFQMQTNFPCGYCEWVFVIP